MKNALNKIAGTPGAWDDRQLGADPSTARRASPEAEAALDAALGMQAISIRLPKQLIEAYKLIAAHHGVGYQPLMRDILQRFAPLGLKEVMEHHAARAAEAEERLQQPESTRKAA